MYVGRIEKLLSYYSPMPMCVVNAQGKVTRASRRIDEVFKYDGIVGADIFALTGIKLQEITGAAEENTVLYLKRNDRNFKVVPGMIGSGETEAILLYFVDVTSYETLKDLYNDEKVCVMVINVDNFDELTSSAGEAREMQISTEIDKLIRTWCTKLEASVTRFREHLYQVILTQKNYRQLVNSRFTILDQAREIETEADFPVTLSIGIGIGGKSPAETDLYAQDALDLALGRGGDQAVVKNAHALKTLMSQSSKVFIMGHRNPDMDSLGASLGIHRVAASMGKESYIILDSYNEALISIAEDAKATGDYEFVSSDKALSLADETSLVVVVDTHRPGLVASMDVINKVNRIVVIDHHRRSEDALPNQLLSYMQSYASSASELVTEVVQYACDKKVLTKMEADALLAGIMVDTNRFAVKAGVRTFEAASWLRRAGADLEKVRSYFQSDADSFRTRAFCVANAKIYDDGIAMSICPGQDPNAQIVNSQVADELLSVKGVKASFVAGQDENGQTVVSARSLGDINVQVVMEKFGGGGHFNTAGAQVDMMPEEILRQIKESLDKSMGL